MSAYLTDDLPPSDLVSSARAIVLKDDRVVTVRTQGAVSVLPGGRVEEGETISGALRRELLEETRWTILDTKQLGLMHFHHLTPKPDEYEYPYPDFLCLVYVAEVLEHDPTLDIKDDMVVESELVPLSEIADLGLYDSGHLFLEAAIKSRCRNVRTAGV